MDEVVKPWEQLDDETDQAHEPFQTSRRPGIQPRPNAALCGTWADAIGGLNRGTKVEIVAEIGTKVASG